jgi:SagB-type dehydrogenase family enzyme
MLPTEQSAIEHWCNRGWQASLEYYLWSKDIPYLDLHDQSGQIRRDKISQYISQRPAPARFRWKGPCEALPQPEQRPLGKTAGHLLVNRRTRRSFSARSVSRSALGSILWFGLDAVRECRRRRRSDPIDYLRSFGVAFEFALAAYNVKGLPAGIYGYDVTRHGLVLVRAGGRRRLVDNCLMKQRAPLTASFTIFFVVDFAQYLWLYRHERALRNLYIEAGRIAQCLILAGENLGCASFPTPAIKDSMANRLLDLNETAHNILYSITMGSRE